MFRLLSATQTPSITTKDVGIQCEHPMQPNFEPLASSSPKRSLEWSEDEFSDTDRDVTFNLSQESKYVVEVSMQLNIHVIQVSI